MEPQVHPKFNKEIKVSEYNIQEINKTKFFVNITIEENPYKLIIKIPPTYPNDAFDLYIDVDNNEINFKKFILDNAGKLYTDYEKIFEYTEFGIWAPRSTINEFLKICEDAKLLTCERKQKPQSGGDYYLQKYNKYKSKYLQLKQSI
jgi:hypothetical protein